MCVEKAHLLLELVLVGPVVVALEQGDVLTTARAVRRQKIVLAFEARPVWAESPRMEKQADALGVASSVGSQDFACAVRRVVVADDDLPFEVRLLIQDALESLRDERRVVEGDDRNADLRSTLAPCRRQ